MVYCNLGFIVTISILIIRETTFPVKFLLSFVEKFQTVAFCNRRMQNFEYFKYLEYYKTYYDQIEDVLKKYQATSRYS